MSWLMRMNESELRRAELERRFSLQYIFLTFTSACDESRALTTHLEGLKEVIQPQVPLRLPCYDFTPVMNHTVVTLSRRLSYPTSGAAHSHGVTGGVYKARERIHRSVLICDY